MKAEPMTEPLSELCHVCDRVFFGDIVRIGFGKWRHEDCYGGSASWMEHYYRIAKPTDEQAILYATMKAKGKS